MARNIFSRKRYRSMRIAMLAATFVAVVFAILTFVTVEVAANAYIQKSYLSEANKLAREREYAAELQKYVNENELSSVDVAELASWAQDNRYLYVMIHKDDKLLFETGKYEPPPKQDDEDITDKNEGADPDNTNPDDPTGGDNTGDGQGTPDGTNPDGTDPDGTDPDGTNPDGTNPDGTDPEGGAGDGTDTEGNGGTGGENPDGTEDGKDPTDENNPEQGKDPDDENSSIGSGITVNMPSREELMKYAQQKGAHLISTSDGSILVSMADFSEYLYYDLTNIAAIILAVIVLVIVVLLYSHGVSRRISRIASDVAVVADGDMDHTIRPDGMDEIGRLSRDVESMRTSMLENMAKERELMDANAELVTSMSHDIRTPLTVLLGYLNVMKLHSPDEEMTSYINASEKTALRLKKMSDDMFNYFLLFGGGAADVELAEYDAYTLFDQMLSEHVLLMREQGYEVELDIASFAGGKITVTTDANLLKRIIENVIQNILKYADKGHPVLFSARKNGDLLDLSITNTVLVRPNAAESNHIGLKTCRKLSSLIGATFTTEEAEGKFTSRLEMPCGEDSKK